MLTLLTAEVTVLPGAEDTLWKAWVKFGLYKEVGVAEVVLEEFDKPFSSADEFVLEK